MFSFDQLKGLFRRAIGGLLDGPPLPKFRYSRYEFVPTLMRRGTEHTGLCIVPRDRSKYMPHEGKRQAERQQRQFARNQAKASA